MEWHPGFIEGPRHRLAEAEAEQWRIVEDAGVFVTHAEADDTGRTRRGVAFSRRGGLDHQRSSSFAWDHTV
ncbi:MAG: hypothetical protein KC457_33040 [Myxococcales bacterium]|nr:hypothetical protein [Myxococcales bacterium]